MTDILEQANYVVIDYDKKRKEKARQVFTDAFLPHVFCLTVTTKSKVTIRSMLLSAAASGLV